MSTYSFNTSTFISTVRPVDRGAGSSWTASESMSAPTASLNLPKLADKFRRAYEEFVGPLRMLEAYARWKIQRDAPDVLSRAHDRHGDNRPELVADGEVVLVCQAVPRVRWNERPICR